LLDIVAGHGHPAEGRVWVDRIPVMPDTRRRLRSRVVDIGPAAPPSLAEALAALSSVLGRRPRVRPLDADASIRLAVSSALAGGRRHVIVRELDHTLAPSDVTALGHDLRGLARASRIIILVSVVDPGPLLHLADHILDPAGARSRPQLVG
jgi:hypothetical protein